MTYVEILKLLKKNGVDTYDAMVAASCDSAWDNVEKKIAKKLKFDYNDFCDLCNSIWLDTEEESLTEIADLVAEFINENEKAPEDYDELYYGPNEDDDDLEEDY